MGGDGGMSGSDQGSKHGETDYGGNDDPQAEQQMQRKHIVVVNGSPEYLDLVRELLQDEHYNVTTTNFVPQTFDMINTLNPDLIITDLIVHQQAGWDLLERLREQSLERRIPLIVTSTDHRLLAQARAEHERFGGDRFIVKPMNVDEILESVASLIGEA
jgi:CheY-like chemotaxis protein